MNVLKYSIMVLIGAISYGTLSSIIKIGYQHGFSGENLVGSQYVVGWLIVFFIFLASRNYHISFVHGALLVITGVLSATIGMTYAISVSELPASVAVVFLFQSIWMGTVIECVLSRRWPGKNRLIAIGILLLGTMLAGGIFGQSLSSLSLKGVMFGCIAAFVFAIYMYCNSRFATKTVATTRLFYISTGAMLTAMLTAKPSPLIREIATSDLVYFGILLGILGVVIPSLLFAIAMPKVGVGLAAILTAAELPSAMITAIILLGEHVTTIQWLGIILIVIGMILPELQNQLSKRKLPFQMKYKKDEENSPIGEP